MRQEKKAGAGKASSKDAKPAAKDPAKVRGMQRAATARC